MKFRNSRVMLACVLVVAALGGPVRVVAAPSNGVGESDGESGRYIALATNAGHYDALRDEATRQGGRVENDLRDADMFVVSGPPSLRDQLAASPHARVVANDAIEHLIDPADQLTPQDPSGGQRRMQVDVSDRPDLQRVRPDPALNLPGLLWNLFRIKAPAAWPITLGDPAVRVGVADTGLDFTHSELAQQVVDVVDFTVTENPPLCKTFAGLSDADLAARFGGPEKTDWNGHGSWIGGNIAAALDGQGINGIAPNVKLVALKISGWCGSAYSSTILNAFQYAADHNIDIVSISFGGYRNPNVAADLELYKMYVEKVAYARSKGTVIVASAGNDHVEIGPGGLVVSHGRLTTPGQPLVDRFGRLQTPGGVPGVVDVGSTGNVVVGSSAFCEPGTITGPPAEPSAAVCKPASDLHQPFGVGKKNQLAYYTNYGSRIDIVAPGGARKFNLPASDRGGTPGFPVTTADKTTAYETFSITSNWGIEIPCYQIRSRGFPANQCYSSIQGTSMATPHVSGVLALIASRYSDLRHQPDALVQRLKSTARTLHGNTTPVLSASDTSPGDMSGRPCPTGYCHLGGAVIQDDLAYGAGLVDAAAAVGRSGEGDRNDDTGD